LGEGRKPRPQYELDVDRDLFGYTDALKAIEHHKVRLVQEALSDMSYMLRLTSNYDNSAIQHMASSSSAEADWRRIDQIEDILQAKRLYVDKVLDGIAYAFQYDKDYRDVLQFIQLYWWSFPHTGVRLRREVVIGSMRFLRQQPSGYWPFYDFRSRVYCRLAEVWGYKGEGNT
jgi:hypothetical protein